MLLSTSTLCGAVVIDRIFQAVINQASRVVITVFVAAASILAPQSAWSQRPASLPQVNNGGMTNSQVVPAQFTQNNNPTSKLEIYNLPPEMVGTVAATLRIKYGVDPTVTITTEPGTDRLMVLAGATVHSEIADAVNRINNEVGLKVPTSSGQAPSPVETQRIYQLRNTNWQGLENDLVAMGGRLLSIYNTSQGDLADYRLPVMDRAQSDIRIDRRNNSVLLQGASKQVAAWQKIVAALDNGHQNGAAPTHIVPMDQAKPDRIRRAVTLVRMVAFQNDVQTDDSTGVVQLPSDDSDGDVAATAIGSADGLGEESGLFGDVQIEFVPELGLVIVRGSKRDVQRVLQVIDEIKKQSEGTQPQVEVVPLEYVDSIALATILNELYTANFAQRQGTVSITGLGQPNAILLIGRREAMDSILELITKLDKPLDPSSQLKVFKLLHTSAVDLQTIVRDFFVTRPGSDTNARAALGTRVSVIADYRTNALIVQASPRDLLELAKLIDEIDVASTQAENEIRVFPLRNAISDELQPILQSAINGQAADGGTTGQATPPSSKLSIQTGPETRLNSGILAGVVVTSNPSINSLVVRAPSKSMELIGALIEQLDQPPNIESQIKVFPIENNDATALAQIIQQVFGQAVTAGVATSGIGAGFNTAAANQGAGNDALVPLRVSVDTRSNSIIASGSKGDLEVVEVLLWRLDEKGVQTRRTQVVWLRNSDANAVATAIQTFLTNQRTAIQQQLLQGQAISIYEQIDQEVIVVAEPATNSLLISATPRYYEQILEVIERLDRRPPLIMVQILLAEVSLDDTFEFGAEFGLQDSLIFDRNSATGGTLSSPAFNLTTPLTGAVTTGQTQKVAGQGLSGFGLGRSNSTLGYGGLVLSAASESVNILVRALQDANRLQILSRPQIMTLDTVEAYVQVGQQVPRVQSVASGSVAVAPTISTVDVPVGLIMRIQPRTNQDGLILLDVQIERSSLGPTDTGIPVGFSANGDVIRSPVINTTRAQTRVSAYDGQTVVFAGLITKSRATRSRRIPYLADIPIAGNLFKFDSETESRSELLAVMTPRIVHSEADLEMINQIESARMSWCLADVVNINGVPNLSPGNGLWGPPCSQIIYPDVQPTVEYIDGLPVDPMIELNMVPSSPASPANVPSILNPVVVPQANSTPLKGNLVSAKTNTTDDSTIQAAPAFNFQNNDGAPPMQPQSVGY